MASAAILYLDPFINIFPLPPLPIQGAKKKTAPIVDAATIILPGFRQKAYAPQFFRYRVRVLTPF
jgi:hypothetical protein